MSIYLVVQCYFDKAYQNDQNVADFFSSKVSSVNFFDGFYDLMWECLLPNSLDWNIKVGQQWWNPCKPLQPLLEVYKLIGRALVWPRGFDEGDDAGARDQVRGWGSRIRSRIRIKTRTKRIRRRMRNLVNFFIRIYNIQPWSLQCSNHDV